MWRGFMVTCCVSSKMCWGLFLTCLVYNHMKGETRRHKRTSPHKIVNTASQKKTSTHHDGNTTRNHQTSSHDKTSQHNDKATPQDKTSRPRKLTLHNTWLFIGLSPFLGSLCFAASCCVIIHVSLYQIKVIAYNKRIETESSRFLRLLV